MSQCLCGGHRTPSRSQSVVRLVGQMPLPIELFLLGSVLYHFCKPRFFPGISVAMGGGEYRMDCRGRGQWPLPCWEPCEGISTTFWSWLFSPLTLFFISLKILIYTHTHHSVRVDIMGQLLWVSVLFLQCIFQGLNSVPQVRQPAPSSVDCVTSSSLWDSCWKSGAGVAWNTSMVRMQGTVHMKIIWVSLYISSISLLSAVFFSVWQ